MNHIRHIARRILYIGILLTITGSSSSKAEPIVLAHLYHSATWVDEEAGQPFRFFFHTALNFENQAELSTFPTPADIGQTFAADSMTVANFDNILTGPIPASIDSGFGQAVPFHEQVATFFDGPFMGDIPTTHSPNNPAIVMKAFVPKLGTNFSGYFITGVDQTIHGFSVDQPSGPNTFYRYWGAHTIRIFGEAVPPLPGDFNRDGGVGAADYVLWRETHGQPISLPNESGLNPGSVDIEDYWFWKSNFGHSAFPVIGLTASQQAPETNTWVLAAVALMTLNMRMCRKC